MRQRFHTTIDSELLLAIKKEALEKTKDVNDIIEDLIKNHLERRNKDECINSNN